MPAQRDFRFRGMARKKMYMNLRDDGFAAAEPHA